MPTDSTPHTALTENHPKVDAEPAPARDLDTATVERVLSALEPVDHTTSFAHEPTTELPMLRAEPPSTAGKRRATKHTDRRSPLFRKLPSAPVLLGIAALAVSVGGAVTVSEPDVATDDAPPITHAASALGGSSGQGKITKRSGQVSRDDARDAQGDTAGQELQEAAEGLAAQRNVALTQLAGAAEKQAKILAKDLWQYPLEPVALTATFGQYGLWSSYHTGLDFNGSNGDTIHSMSSGEVISASYDGAYGNKTVIRLEDGTEIWYCHQTTFLVSAGETVRPGDVIGTVGSTGNVTGSHLHVEVHPGGGDAVDPYTAMQQHGLF